jgi:DNA-binding NarL/FixJ family response regulator
MEEQKPPFSLKDMFCLIVEDQEPARRFIEGLVASAFPGIFIESLADLRQAKRWLVEGGARKADRELGLAIIDLGLPDGSGIELVRLLAESEPAAHSVVYTMYGDDSYLFEALAAGARGFLLKEESSDCHLESLRKIERGEPPLSPSVARRILGYFQGKEKPKELGSGVRLTPREQEALVLLARGLTIPEAAGKMGLSPQTVAGYVKIIYQKLHVSNRVELVREANRLKLI